MRRNYSSEQLQKILDAYPSLGTLRSARLFTTGYENSNHYVETDADRYVIKIFEGMGVTAKNIIFELEVMDKCYEAGLKTPRVLRALAGGLEVLSGDRHAMVMDFIGGENMHQKVLTDSLVSEVGEEMGRMDKVLESFRDGGSARQNYEFDLKNTLLLEKTVALLPPHFSRGIFKDIFKRFRALKERFDSLPAGLIHNDVVPHNLLVKDGRLAGIVDFSDMVFSPYVQNLAVSLHLMVFGYNWQPSQARLFIDGYRRHHDLSDSEIAYLYDLILARFASFVIEFNRWNVEFGEDQDRVETINDQYQFLQKFLALKQLDI